ncbi:MAG: leucyl aminopeptidase, partial [Actinomyces graevenitzii]|nr:leucyl aminopeptidase [Actinomyces graevenitzii]
MRGMSELIASKEALTTVEVNNLILLASAGADGVVLHLPEHKGLEGLGQSAAQKLAETAQELGFKASLDQMLRLPAGVVSGLSAKNILLVGVGKQQLSQETLRRAAGRATRELSGTDSAAIAFPTPTAQDSVAVAEGALLGAYVWARRIPASPEPVAKIYVLGACPEEIERAQKVVSGVNIARDLVNDPPNKLVPADFANFAKQAVKQLPVDYQVWEEKQLVKEGFGGIIGVGKGSIHPPRLVRLDYHPKSAKSHVALIGKGITFDSGGLSIKPASSMPEMKSDMAGAAAVLGTVIAAASLGVDVHVTGWLAIAENLPANDATRPSDVITMFNGKTVEVTNTDAEGRLVLCDVLTYVERFEPEAVI